MSASNPSPTISDSRTPAEWWRTLCEVVMPKRNGARIVVSGDLHHEPNQALKQLRQWQAYGITHILDVRGEYSDIKFVAKHAPEITYIECGSHDDGGHQDDSWFDNALEGVGAALFEESSVILINCHMGVSRAPSCSVRLLLAQGYDPLPVLDAIRKARPIAAILYAEDAVDHWLANESVEVRRDARRTVRAWHDENPVDLGWIISRIRQVEHN